MNHLTLVTTSLALVVALAACKAPEAPASGAGAESAAGAPSSPPAAAEEPSPEAGESMGHNEHADHAGHAEHADHAGHAEHAEHAEATDDGASGNAPGEMDSVLEEGEYDPAELVQQPGAEADDVTRCPVSGEVFRVTEDSAYYAHEGENVYFCCSRCIRRFQRDPARYLEAG